MRKDGTGHLCEREFVRPGRIDGSDCNDGGDDSDDIVDKEGCEEDGYDEA